MSRKENARLIVEDIARVARELGSVPSERVYLASKLAKFSKQQIKAAFSTWETAKRAAGLDSWVDMKPQKLEAFEPKILFFDIETKPLEVFSFGIWEQNIGHNQIKSDWCVFSWAAMWKGSTEVMYMDQRRARNITDDKRILKGIWKLLDEADVVITQNGKSFDEKKLNTRFIINGLGSPSPFAHIDTKQLAKRRFSFTSNSLEYLCKALKTVHQKLKHGKFPGMELWIECINRNLQAWNEMELYNKHDVLCLADVYEKLAPWGVGTNLNAFYSDATYRCHCGSKSLESRGHGTNKQGRYRRFQCKGCGAWHSTSGSANNLFSPLKRASMKTPKEE